MNNIKQSSSMLHVLEKSHHKLRQAILQNADHKLICILAEIILNFMQGNIAVTPSQKKKLVKYKKPFRFIYKQCHSKHGIKHNKKGIRKAVVQSGGALPFLIPLLAPLIAKAALGGIAATTAGILTKKAFGEK